MSGSSIRWLAQATHQDQAIARVGIEGDTLVAEWHGIGRLTSRRDGSDAAFTPAKNVDAVLEQKIRGGMAQLLLRSLQGKIGLHGAAVCVADRAVAFLGESGVGKSTLAAGMSQALGAHLLSDDAIALEHDPVWRVVPLERFHFLDEVASVTVNAGASTGRIPSGKLAVPSRSVAPGEVGLAALIHLRFEDCVPVLEPVDPVSALGFVVPQTVRFAIDDPKCHKIEFDRLVGLVQDVPMFDLVRPRRFAAFQTTIEMLRRAFFSESTPR